MLYKAHIARPKMQRSLQILIEAKNLRDAEKLARQEARKLEESAKVTTVFRADLG